MGGFHPTTTFEIRLGSICFYYITRSSMIYADTEDAEQLLH